MAGRNLDEQTSQQAARRPKPDDVLAHLIAALRADKDPDLVAFDDQPALDPACFNVLRARLETAWAEGLLRLTPDQFCDVVMVLAPEEYVVSLPATPPSQDAVGTPGRLSRYAERASRREAIFDTADADAARDDRRGVRAHARSNGTGVKSVGWDTEEVPEIEPGMYRAPDGKFFELG